MIKLTLISGTELYTDYSLNKVSMLMNSANIGKTSHMDAYKDVGKSEKVNVQIRNIEYFEEV